MLPGQVRFLLPLGYLGSVQNSAVILAVAGLPSGMAHLQLHPLSAGRTHIWQERIRSHRTVPDTRATAHLTPPPPTILSRLLREAMAEV